MNSKKEGTVTKGSADKPGVMLSKEGITFSVFLPAEKECRLNLYHKASGRQLISFRLTEEVKNGNIFSAFIKYKQLKKYFEEQEDPVKSLGYLYETRQGEFLDPGAALVYGREEFAKREGRLLGGISGKEYDWEEDRPIQRPYSDTLVYKLHVRGFTMDASSKVQCPGTFLGITEKIPYLKELGVNCLLLMPAYEFDESMKEEGITDRINYWGYSLLNSFFAPKAAYAYSKDEPDTEFKDMVKLLHQNGMEVMMEMNFTAGTNTVFAMECLRHWVRDYHVDGFKLSNETVPVSVLASDPVLGSTKILSEGWDYKTPPEKKKVFQNYGECNNNYSNTCKRFLRGDEEQVKEFARQFTCLCEESGSVKYITNHDGFTLIDLFSYDKKHNEANGENNRDGQEYNFSWNCGKEGRTGKSSVLEMRKRQVRNAFAILLLSQGTPLILSGDEFLNSQEGNNNPYCQDNKLSWLNWDNLIKEEETFHWVKTLIHIRKEHPVFRRSEPFHYMDYIYCGMPDISFHGTNPWYAEYDHYSRQLGVMLCGAYARKGHTGFDDSFYLAFNFHWESREFHLPDAPSGEAWKLFLSTSEGYIEVEDEKEMAEREKEAKEKESKEKEAKEKEAKKIETKKIEVKNAAMPEIKEADEKEGKEIEKSFTLSARSVRVYKSCKV